MITQEWDIGHYHTCYVLALIEELKDNFVIVLGS